MQSSKNTLKVTFFSYRKTHEVHIWKSYNVLFFLTIDFTKEEHNNMLNALFFAAF